jgi:hypothetical protein
MSNQNASKQLVSCEKRALSQIATNGFELALNLEEMKTARVI